MPRSFWIALLLGVLLITAPLTRAEDDDDYEDDDDDEEESAASASDVVELTAKNFEEHVTKRNYALVRDRRPGSAMPLRWRCNCTSR